METRYPSPSDGGALPEAPDILYWQLKLFWWFLIHRFHTVMYSVIDFFVLSFFYMSSSVTKFSVSSLSMSPCPLPVFKQLHDSCFSVSIAAVVNPRFSGHPLAVFSLNFQQSWATAAWAGGAK